MNQFVTLFLSTLLVSSVSFAAGKDKLRLVCQKYIEGEPVNSVMILEQVDVDSTSGSKFLKDGKRETDRISFDLKILKGNLNLGDKPLLDISNEILKNNKLANIENHEGETISVDVNGSASIVESNLVFTYNGSPSLRLRLYDNSPEYVSIDIDGHFGQGFQCPLISGKTNWLKIPVKEKAPIPNTQTAELLDNDQGIENAEAADFDTEFN